MHPNVIFLFNPEKKKLLELRKDVETLVSMFKLGVSFLYYLTVYPHVDGTWHRVGK